MEKSIYTVLLINISMCLHRSGKEYGFYCLHILSKVVKKVNVYIFFRLLLQECWIQQKLFTLIVYIIH